MDIAGGTPSAGIPIEGDVNVEFEEAASRQQLNSGESVKTLFGKLRKFLTDLKAVAFSGSYSDLNDTPDLSQYAKRSIYGDTAINLGRKAGTTVGDKSTAEGHNTTASAYYCHAEGQDTQALGNYSHAEGYNTKAESAYDHAEGLDTIASGGYSHAEGGSCKATAIASHAEGYHTKTTNIAEHACGKYNASTYDETLMSVGDGTSEEKRHNAFEITKTGGNLHDKKIAVVNDIPSPNLLINPNFKINQRGNAMVSTAGAYISDRWKLVSGSAMVNDDGTIHLSGSMCQILENAVGGDAVASSSAGAATYDDSTKTFTLTASGENISWCKLEHGSVATPFIAPDPVEELMKCQRYCVVVPNGRYFRASFVGTSVMQFLLPLPVSMVNVPSIVSGTMGVILLNLSTSSQADTSFTFSFTGIKNNILTVQATKSNSAIDGALFVTEELVLSADL